MWVCVFFAVEVRTLLHLFGRNVYAVDDDTALLDLLTAFKKGESSSVSLRLLFSTNISLLVL